MTAQLASPASFSSYLGSSSSSSFSSLGSNSYNGSGFSSGSQSLARTLYTTNNTSDSTDTRNFGGASTSFNVGGAAADTLVNAALNIMRTGAVNTAQASTVAQVFPPTIIITQPPIRVIPRGMAPYEELPVGSGGGPGAGKAFPRPDPMAPGTRCTYCGKETTIERGPQQYHRDHVVPKSKGGNNTPENKAPSCRDCNLQKRDRTPQEWYRAMGWDEIADNDAVDRETPWSMYGSLLAAVRVRRQEDEDLDL